jgi:hypothetical protein
MGIIALSLGLSAMNPFFPELSHISSSPLAYLFQILFLLFFISPPVIAILLFLIWKELRDRNKLK